MPLVEVASGLRRRTAWHEEWQEDVGCLAVDTADGLVLIDPLDPPRGLGRPQHVLLMLFFDARSTRAPHVWRGEVVYWLPRQRALAVGDVLLGAGAKPRATDAPLRLCPERWLGKATHDDLRDSLAPMLELPVARVMVSHGEPVLRGSRGALATVLAG
jgi:hypothetical protein